MQPRQDRRRRKRAVVAGVCAVVAATAALFASAFSSSSSAAGPQRSRAQGAPSTFTVTRRDFVRAVRLSGTVEAIQSMTISAPRLSGPNANSLVITRLVRAGSTVKAGDLLVEFDRQQQLTNALDRRAELQDLEQQIRKREAQEQAAAAKDESEIKQAESAQ